MSDSKNAAWAVEGTVSPGFESVRLLYAEQMAMMAERNTQLCVYYRGERVVDLWASKVGDTGFSPDSIVNIFSSGKSLESIALAALVGQGRLEYDAKIAHYWPEFSTKGKADLTVADLMRHEAGLAGFTVSMPPESLAVDQIKQNRVGEIIEQESARFREMGGERREYHAITRGWVANELFRRVEPAGRTMGEFFRDEISGPLGADVLIGVPESELGRVSKVVQLGVIAHFLKSLKPAFLGRSVKHGFFTLVRRLFRMVAGLASAPSRGGPPPYVGMKDIEFFNERSVAMGETPSAAANASARGLAKVAAMMAAGGEWAGRKLITEEGWRAMHGAPADGNIGFGMTRFTQGGVNEFIETNDQSSELDRAFNAGREGFFGWMGLGGSIFQWNPEKEIGFSFVPTSLHLLDVLNERGKVYQAEVLRCVDALSRSDA